nr:MAG TPA: resistance protein [Caudoviricetes sp.]
MANEFSLYRLTSDYKRFTELVENGDISEEDMQDTLDSIAEDINTKLDNTCSYIKTLKMQIDGMTKAKAELDERIKRKKNVITRLEYYITQCMVNSGMNQFESTNHRVTFKPSNAVVITDERLLFDYLKRDYPDAIRVTEKQEVDKKAVAKIIQDGGQIGGAFIEHRYNPQIK